MASRSQTQSTASGTVTSATVSTIEDSGSGLGSYPGYHIAITSGTGKGQIRYAFASSGADKLRLTQKWDTVPDTSSKWHVAWNQDDYDGGWGNDFKLVLKAAAEWDVGADSATLGDGTDPVVGGIANQAFSQDEYWVIRDQSFFAMGYLWDDPPEEKTLGGWYWNSNNANSTLGFQYVRVSAGGTLFVANTNCGTVYAHSFICQSSSFAHFYDASYTNLCRNGTRLKGYSYGENLKFQGVSGVTDDYLVLASGFESFNGPLILNNIPAGIRSSAVKETIRVNNFINTNGDIDVIANNSTTWEFVNPQWNGTTASTTWTQNDGQSQIYEYYQVSANVKDVSGSALSSSVFEIADYRNGYSYSSAETANREVATTSGVVSFDLLTRQYVSTTSRIEYGEHVARAWKYGYSPFETAVTSAQIENYAIGLATDAEVAESEASALLHSDIIVRSYATALNVLAYASGATAFTTSAVASGAVSGAHGTVQEYLGDATSGVVVLGERDGTPWTNGEDLYVLGTRYAEASTDNFDAGYTWEIMCNTNSVQKGYDYHMAKMASTSTTVDAWVSSVRQRSTQMIDAAGGTYQTEAYYSTGVWISRRGSGTINYMTADDGTQYIPPVSYTFELTGLQTGSEIRMYRTDDDTAIAGTESSGASFSYNYTYGGDIGFYLIIFHLNYKEQRLVGQTLSNANVSLPIQQIVDRAYANP